MHSLPESCAARMCEVNTQDSITTSPAKHLAGWQTTSEMSTEYPPAAVNRQYRIRGEGGCQQLQGARVDNRWNTVGTRSYHEESDTIETKRLVVE